MMFSSEIGSLKKSSAQTFWEIYWVYPYSLLRYLKPMEWWRFTIIKINMATPKVPSCLTARALSRIACRALGVHLPWSAKCLRCWGLMFYLKFSRHANRMKTTDSSQHCQPVEEKNLMRHWFWHLFMFVFFESGSTWSYIHQPHHRFA